MKMSKAFLLIALVSFVLGVAAITPWARRSLDWSVDQLIGAQKENVRSVLAGAIRDKQIYLENVSKIVQSDANLAGALVLADTSSDYQMFDELLAELKVKSNLTYFEAMPLNKQMSNSEAVNECLNGYTEEQTVALCKNGDGIMMTLRAPLYLYGTKVGTMFLGADILDSTFLANTAQIQLVKSENADLNEIYRLNGISLLADLRPDDALIKSVAARLNTLMIAGAIVTFLFMLVVIGTAAHFLFLKPFHKILAKLDEAFAHVEKRLLYTFGGKKEFLLENRKLVAVLEIFLAKIKTYDEQLALSNAQLIENEKAAAVGRLSRQVAHDIRSPLTALRLSLPEIDKLPEGHRQLVNMAIERITNIADDLLKSSRVQKTVTSANANLGPCLKVCIDEKQVIARERNVHVVAGTSLEDLDITVRLAANPLQNMISNILSNAVEASAPGATVTLHVNARAEEVDIIIKDQGTGIPPHILERLGKEEISFGKAGGNGLGLFLAQKLLVSVGGRLQINSKLNEGTEVVVTVPIYGDSVVLKSIDIKRGAEIVVIDDDKTVHEVWRHRLGDLAFEQTVIANNVMTADDFAEWLEKRPEARTGDFQFLVDYEFHNSKLNGLDLIEKFNFADRAILVTSHSSDSEVIERCKALKVRLLPKTILATAPINLI